MIIDSKSMEKRRCHSEFEDNISECSRRSTENLVSGKRLNIEQDKRVRREIANSNERRRMKSINAGFDTLRVLLPPVQDGEKMSKATILQLTAKYITSLRTRLNVLENELSAYRQTANNEFTTTAPEFSEGAPVSRKRRCDDSRKRCDTTRSHRRDVQPNIFLCSPHANVSGLSPTSSSTQVASPTSFNTSASISPTSPQLDVYGSTASARLEHLVMAIEQIEGGKSLNASSEFDSHDGSFSACDQSPIRGDSYWQSPQRAFGFNMADESGQKNAPNTFPEVYMLTSVPDVNNSTSASSVDDNSFNQSSVEDYPIVAKLLNRPIPHKYLHRPQVVVNSSH